MTQGRSGASPTARPPIPPAQRVLFELGPQGSSPRILWAGIALGVALLLIAGQLVRVQLVLGDEYQERGLSQRQHSVELPTRRGRLYDRNGNVLATDIDTVTVVVDPWFFGPQPREDGTVVQLPEAERIAIAERLAPIVDRDVDWISERMLRPDSRFEYIRRQLPWEVRDELLALQADNLLDGVHLVTEPVRTYPAGPMAGQVLGFTGIDNDGRHGLEHHHEDLLVGTPGRVDYETAPGGLSIAAGERIVTEAEPGTDLVLTLDQQVQWIAEQAALRAVAEYEAAGASVVVMEVGTGDVLAMANVPVLDPANPSGLEQEQWRNRAVTDVFEPGSVQKTVTAAAALEEGVVTPDTVFTVEDAWKVGNKTFTDSHEHPTEELTFTEIIEESSNVGTIKVAQELGDRRLGHWLHRFGYGQRTGIGFDAESPGILAPTDQWWNTSLPTIAIGHGVAVTLTQMAQVYGTIANGGVLVAPRLVRGTVDAAGNLVPADPSPARRVVSAATANKVGSILGSVISGERGTGSRARIPGYSAAGKTGTALKVSPNGGYTSEYIASFVGFAPAENPRIVVAVMVDEPQTAIYGGIVAAPVFSEVAGAALQRLNVLPTSPIRPLTDDLAAAADLRAMLEETGPGLEQP